MNLNSLYYNRQAARNRAYPYRRNYPLQLYGQAAAGIAANLGAKYLSSGSKSLRGSGAKSVTVRINRPKAGILKKGKTLKKQVRNLQKKAKATEATHTHRVISPDRLYPNVYNKVAYASYLGFSTTSIEAMLANLRYYDPSNPGTLITSDGSSGTYNRNFLFTKNSTSITMKNNYQTPCTVRVYLVAPKEDTSIESETAFSNGMVDQMITASTDSMITYPTDSEQFRKLWDIKKSWNKTLQAGQELTCSNSPKDFTYDPSNVDSHALLYQKRYQSHKFFIRVHGGIVHDSSANAQGFDKCGLDIIYKASVKIVYDAGVNLEDVSIDDNLDAITTGISSSKPVADNISFSAT